MIIRQIEDVDAKLLLDLMLALDQETKYMLFEPGERNTTPEQLKARIESINEAKDAFFVIKEEEELVGYISGTRGTANRIKHSAYIVMGIRESYCGKGLGKKLFEDLIEWANKVGITRLELTVVAENKRAVALYEKVGFKIEGTKEKSMVIEGKLVDEYYMGKIIED